MLHMFVLVLKDYFIYIYQLCMVYRYNFKQNADMKMKVKHISLFHVVILCQCSHYLSKHC